MDQSSQTRTADTGLWVSDPWAQTSFEDTQAYQPSLSELNGLHGFDGSPPPSAGSTATPMEYQDDYLEQCVLKDTAYPGIELIDDSLLDSYCTNSPSSIDLRRSSSDPTKSSHGRFQRIESLSEADHPGKEDRLARRQAQNREAQRAHRAKQKSKLSTLENRVKLAESNCRILEEANQRMENVLRNLVNDAVKALASPAQATRSSKVAMDETGLSLG